MRWCPGFSRSLALSIPRPDRLKAIHQRPRPTVSRQVLAELRELGKLNRGEIAKLVGVAPIIRDSGTKSGKRFIGGGRGQVRRVLYMATIVAIRYNPGNKAFYLHLKSKPLPPNLWAALQYPTDAGLAKHGLLMDDLCGQKSMSVSSEPFSCPGGWIFKGMARCPKVSSGCVSIEPLASKTHQQPTAIFCHQRGRHGP